MSTPYALHIFDGEDELAVISAWHSGFTALALERTIEFVEAYLVTDDNTDTLRRIALAAHAMGATCNVADIEFCYERFPDIDLLMTAFVHITFGDQKEDMYAKGEVFLQLADMSFTIDAFEEYDSVEECCEIFDVPVSKMRVLDPPVFENIPVVFIKDLLSLIEDLERESIANDKPFCWLRPDGTVFVPIY